MSKRVKTEGVPVYLLVGDGFLVRRRAETIVRKWQAELVNAEVEVVDCERAGAGKSRDAALAVLEALRTYGFFGRAKIIWVRNAEALLGGGRESADAETRDAPIEGESGSGRGSDRADVELGRLVDELSAFEWSEPVPTRMVLTATTADKRRALVKLLGRIGAVEEFPVLSPDVQGWEALAAGMAEQALRVRGKQIEEDALQEMVLRVGADAAALDNEAEKLALYVGHRSVVTLADVREICSRSRYARAFALGDALGERDLAGAMRFLDDELHESRPGAGRSEVGLLYGVIAKVRLMLLMKGLEERGLLRRVGTYSQFKSQLERIPAEVLPADARLSPTGRHPFLLYKAWKHSQNYSRSELVEALGALLECNIKLVFSDLDEALALQRMLVRIMAPRAVSARASAPHGS